MSQMPLLEVRDLRKSYLIKKIFKKPIPVSALDGVSFCLDEGRTLAIVGESGCGKSTLAKCLMQIELASSGEVIWDGKPMADLTARDWRSRVQMIFQDPYSSLNPRRKCLDIIAEPLIIAGGLPRQEVYARAREAMRQVGLRPEFEERYPHMFSGGQRQRIGIARALMLRPKLLICDEPVSALDVSIQAQVLNLLMDLQDELNLSYLFISHDLSVVRHISDDVLVMYFGQVMEYGPRERIFSSPRHPYTKALLASHPDLNTSHSLGESHQSKEPAHVIEGELPSPLNPPRGCPFEKRCPQALAVCGEKRPSPTLVDGRISACHLS